MEDVLGPAHRAAHGATVEDVAAHGLDPELLQLGGVRTHESKRAKPIAPLGQQPHDMRANESGRAGEKRRGHDREEPSRVRPAMPVTIVTDTCHYLPASLLEEHGIRQVSLYIHWRDQA